MHVDIAPRRATAQPEVPTLVQVTVSNTSDVIVGCSLRVLGADPSWVSVSTPEPRLFPHESTVVAITITLPHGTPAGERRIAVQVRDLADAGAVSIEDVVLEVPPAPRVTLEVTPPVVTARRSATFDVVLTNEGNSVQSGRVTATDPEAKTTFRYSPRGFTMNPGESVPMTVSARARRPFAGDPKLRTFELAVTGAAPALEPPMPPSPAVFVQKARFSRGVLGLIGLLLAVSVFALVVVVALSSVVNRSAADRELALQVAQAKEQAATTGSSSLAGSVIDLSSGSPVPNVSVAAFPATDPTTPLVTSATTASGTFTVAGLPAGTYVLRVQGAGYSDVWYPAAAAPADAKQIEVSAGKSVGDLTVIVGGTPATLAGKVEGDDVAGAVLQVQLPLTATGPGATTTSADKASGSKTSGSKTSADKASGTTTSADGASVTSADTVSGAPADDGGTGGGSTSGGGTATSGVPQGAVVTTAPIGADGTFTVADLPSPAVYDLVVTKAGFASTVQRIDVGAGEDRAGVTLSLLTGDGSISGTVTGLDGPVGGATITATSGQTTAETVSLTQDQVGSFVLRGLPTPGSYTVVVSADGYSSATLSLTLGSGQALTGVAVVLGTDTGSLAGTVKAVGASAGGVSVTVTDGALTLQTVTQSTDPVGRWSISGLRVPSTYTVTFAKAGLESQVLSVSIDGFGRVTAGAASAKAVDATLRLADARLSGTVKQSASGSAATRVGNVTVTVSSGTVERVVTTASTPASDRGFYAIDNLPPGTYTVTFTRAGTATTSAIITLSAGEDRTYSPVLVAPARISGTVTVSGAPGSGLTVNLYRASEYGTAAGPVATTTTTTTGGYVFLDVDAPEHYIVEVRTSPTGSVLGTSAPITLSASQSATYDASY